MPIDFDVIASWMDAGDLTSLTAALLAVDEQDRRALAGRLRLYTLPDRPRSLFDPALSYEEHQHRWRAEERRWPYRQAALRVAGAACLPRATDVVAWLRSPRFWDPVPADAAEAVARVLQAPGRPSAAAVARGLAGRLRPAQVDRQWPIVSALLRATGQTPPATEATVRGWLRETGLAADRLAADPWTPMMLPHAFSVPRVGDELDGSGPAALVRLCTVGGYDRAIMLADCLGRLGEGDRPGALRPFVALHRMMEPTLDETARRAQQYIGLLSSPHSTVAAIGQETLRALDDAGRLETGAVAEATFAVLARTEKKLVRPQLAWLDAALKRKPDPELYAALLTGLGSPATDLAELTLTIAIRHLPAIGAAGRELLADAAVLLDGDLRRRADAVLGDAAPGPVPTPVIPSAPAPAAPMPAPFGSVDEVAAAAAVLVRRGREFSDPVLLERLLDGLVRFARTDRDALAAALRPVIPAHMGSPVIDLLRAITDGHWTKRFPQYVERMAPPYWMLAGRVNELGRQIPYTAPAGLLATPATVDGHVDPARVLALLRAAEADGLSPRPYDLSQALLRLPRTVDAAIADAAERLTTPAGRAFAAWLRDGGLPDPAVVIRQPCTHGPGCGCTREDQRRTVVVTPAGETALTVPPGLLDIDGGPSSLGDGGAASWPMVLPNHREIIAAHLQPHLATAIADQRGGACAVLPVLARSGGPFGPAIALCLAHGLTAARPADRVAAVDAFLILAGRPDVDGGLVGRELAALFGTESLVLTRVVATLAEAMRAGAAPQVWDATRRLIPAVLAVTPAAPGTPDLLALAASAASAAKATATLPEVAAVAARGGRSRLVTEAARLVRTLDLCRP